jgi:hypothetical protein
MSSVVRQSDCRIHPAPEGAGILLALYNDSERVSVIHSDHALPRLSTDAITS